MVLSSSPVTTAQAPAQPAPAYQRFLSPASPLEVVAAKKVDRVAWVAFEEGKRNAYTAAAPAFVPVRLTNFLKDDGIGTHESMLHGRWMYTMGRMETFLKKFLDPGRR